MKVVVTGAAGFIGSNFARHWHERHPQDEIVAYDLLTYAGRLESLEDLMGKQRFSFVRGDVADPVAVRTVLAGAELVVHFAAETHNDRAIVDPTPFIRTNVTGTATLLEECRRLDTPRFHHVSTDEVFGSLPLDGGARFTEESPYRPRGPYSASKAASDHLVRAWFETYGLKVTLSNCGNNFGPYQFPEKLIPLAVLRLLQGKKVPLYGDGRHVRDWIYILDHLEALERIVLRGRPGSTYLVSAENELSNRSLVERLLLEFGRGPDGIEFVPDRPGHDRRYALDPSRLKNELGWSARHSFEEALRETVLWYRNHPAWWRPLLQVSEEVGRPTAKGVG